MTEQTTKNYIEELLAEKRALEEEVEGKKRVINELKIKNIVDTFDVYKFNVSEVKDKIEKINADALYEDPFIQVSWKYFGSSLRSDDFVKLHQKAHKMKVSFDDLLNELGKKIYGVYQEIKEEGNNNDYNCKQAN